MRSILLGLAASLALALGSATRASASEITCMPCNDEGCRTESTLCGDLGCLREKDCDHECRLPVSCDHGDRDDCGCKEGGGGVQPPSVPEPGSVSLLLLGLAAAGRTVRRKIS